MTIEEIMRLRDGGEQTNVQFKERITRKSKSEIAGEMVALSNTHGGKIIIGINDKSGKVNSRSYSEELW